MSETKKLTLPVVDLARENDEFRKVVWTGEKTQLVLMAIPEGGEIGGDVSIVPSGAFHNFRNTGSGMLKLFTTYSPPEHEPGTEHATKSEADADE